MVETDIEQKEKKIGVPFKEFLDQCTNLMTVFGILNALYIYAGTLTNDEVKIFLLPSLFVLSMLVWFEIILFTLRCDNNSWKYSIFYFCSGVIEIGLAWYFAVTFYPLLIGIGAIGVYYGLIYGLTMGLISLLPTWSIRIIKRKNIQTKKIAAGAMIIAIMLAAMILKFALQYLGTLTSQD